MSENHLPEDPLAEDETPEEPDLRAEPEPEPVETRGLGWLIVPPLVGGLIGLLVGLAKGGGAKPEPGEVPPQQFYPIVGLIAGGIFGLFVWVMFPYKGRNPHAPPPEEKPGDAKPAPEGPADPNAPPDPDPGKSEKSS
jgi:hypothetical protein